MINYFIIIILLQVFGLNVLCDNSKDSTTKNYIDDIRILYKYESQLQEISKHKSNYILCEKDKSNMEIENGTNKLILFFKMKCTLNNLNSSADVLAALNSMEYFNNNRLDTIKFHNSDIPSLDIGTFVKRNLSHLQNLIARDIGLEKLETNFLHNFKKMGTLDFSRNRIRIIDMLFNDMNIAFLDLSNNKICYIAKFAFHNSNIDHLNLRNNQISSVQFLGMKNSYVNINYCNIKSLDISRSAFLREVSLNGNIKTFIAERTTLREIYFPQNLTLTTLLLSNTSISKSTIENIMQIESLERLDLSYNFMGSVNVSVSAILKLKHLSSLKVKSTNITSNELSKLRDNLKSLESLEVDDDGNQE